MHQRAPNLKINIITKSTNRERTATAGYIIKKAMIKCHFLVYAALNIPVKKLAAAEMPTEAGCVEGLWSNLHYPHCKDGRNELVGSCSQAL